jgi:molybdate transport system ATP-binding protein
MLEVDARIRRGALGIEASFALGTGSILGVFGPSGAGKTSVLEAIAGLAGIEEGAIRLDGRVLSEPGRRVPPELRGVGLVRQRPALFAHLDVRSNVAFSRRADRRDVEDLLARFGLAELGHRRPGELSGGQAQRVAIARALAARPRVLLLDEPMRGLDHAIAAEVLSAIREAASRSAVIVVEHDLGTLARLADVLMVLDNGRQLQLAPPAHLQRSPASAEVARLIGMVGPLRWGGDEVFAWREDLWASADPGPDPSVAVVIEEPARFVEGRYEVLVRHGELGSLSVRAVGPLEPGTGWLSLAPQAAVRAGSSRP